MNVIREQYGMHGREAILAVESAQDANCDLDVPKSMLVNVTGF